MCCPILEVMTLGLLMRIVDGNTHAISIVGVDGAGLRFLRVKFGCSLATMLPTFE